MDDIVRCIPECPPEFGGEHRVSQRASDNGNAPRGCGSSSSIRVPMEGDRVLDSLGFDARITRVVGPEEDGFLVITTAHLSPVFVMLEDPDEPLWLLDPAKSWPEGKCRKA